MALTAAQMSMLEAMFPRHIMEQIAAQGASMERGKRPGALGGGPAAGLDLDMMATQHECVTIMFTDIVGFTAFSKECTPGQVMSFLNELFSKLDDLLDKHSVYKVETAGDCYIICAGLLDEDEDGFKTVSTASPSPAAKAKAARRALNFTMDMMQVASTVMMPNTGKPVVLRAGLHSGPVVSGLIGSRLLKFSLFGDTMNTASRMESTSLPGRIQVSQATLDLLRDAQPSRWEPTGGVEVKGKGLMQTSLLSQEATRSYGRRPLRRMSTRKAPTDCSAAVTAPQTSALCSPDQPTTPYPKAGTFPVSDVFTIRLSCRTSDKPPALYLSSTDSETTARPWPPEATEAEAAEAEAAEAAAVGGLPGGVEAALPLPDPVPAGVALERKGAFLLDRDSLRLSHHAQASCREGCTGRGSNRLLSSLRAGYSSVNGWVAGDTGRVLPGEGARVMRTPSRSLAGAVADSWSPVTYAQAYGHGRLHSGESCRAGQGMGLGLGLGPMLGRSSSVSGSMSGTSIESGSEPAGGECW
ncbi:adenylate and guanylate cyclase catalytic domain-containing protein [Haematococcus lacustris]